ncbi:hypothetical protein [Halpernia frigidisoli]|uniref:Uncharacterized protein n=1 Tax=Halpernia frigidisoli TaxID=1125876 RepID=A0A1I3EH93_9FLAO|nr:hypothetical protein [Halpernia frigidisoli]SFH98071.1 hypothetical protein SAMN05443292_1068 [Halpernia frigidisoli]
MKFTTLFILIVLSINSFGQTNELKTSDIVPFTSTIEISNGKVTGTGAEKLENEIKTSQFFMLGEEHFSPQISQLTNVLLPIFKRNGYDNFALEVGPLSAKKLQTKIKIHSSLFEFNHSFYSKYNEIPIPFFDGTLDEVFLKTALNNNFKLWGLDQEYLSAHLFLIDDIYQLSSDKRLLKTFYDQAKTFIKEEFNKENEDEDYPTFTNLLNAEEIKQFFNKCKSKKQKEIISEIIKSWEIYKLNETKEYNTSNVTRMENMKRNFAYDYKNAQKNNNLPKVLIKTGAMHLGYGKSWLGIYDLGNMVNELAYFNNTKSTSINCFSRYSENEDGSIYDFKDDEYGKNLSLILELATKDKWTLLDTKKIIELSRKRKVKLNNDLDFILSRYDYILFAPLKTKMKKNY